jgi:hypothetical protein
LQQSELGPGACERNGRRVRHSSILWRFYESYGRCCYFDSISRTKEASRYTAYASLRSSLIHSFPRTSIGVNCVIFGQQSQEEEHLFATLQNSLGRNRSAHRSRQDDIDGRSHCSQWTGKFLSLSRALHDIQMSLNSTEG